MTGFDKLGKGKLKKIWDDVYRAVVFEPWLMCEKEKRLCSFDN